MTVHIVVLGEKKNQPYCMALPTREFNPEFATQLGDKAEAVEAAFHKIYDEKMENADLVIVWLRDYRALREVPQHLLKSLWQARDLKKCIVFVWADHIEEDIAFWHKPFPQLYHCCRCGKYALMEEAEPWAGHNCNSQPVPSVISNISDLIGEFELVAYGDLAKNLWSNLKENIKIC